MEIKKFLRSVLPSIEKENVDDDLRQTANELDRVVLPTYETAAKLFKGRKMASDELKADQIVFGRNLKAPANENQVLTIARVNQAVMSNVQALEKYVATTYGEDIAASGLTYRKATVLQLVELASFYAKYAMAYLKRIYILETAALEEGADPEEQTPADIQWLKANFLSFIRTAEILSQADMTFKRNIDGIADIVVTEDNVDTLPQTLGLNKVDPFKLGLIPVWLNPVYHIGIVVAEFQAARYDAAKEELQNLNLRKLNMELLIAGKPNAKVQKDIEYTQSRIDKLRYKIAQMEERYA